MERENGTMVFDVFSSFFAVGDGRCLMSNMFHCNVTSFDEQSKNIHNFFHIIFVLVMKNISINLQ